MLLGAFVLNSGTGKFENPAYSWTALHNSGIQRSGSGGVKEANRPFWRDCQHEIFLGNIRPKPPKRWLFCPKFLQKPNRRRNKLAGFASKAFVIVILALKNNIYHKNEAFFNAFKQ
jgi:hypothetical protein